jgi:RNA polymerase sigma-70 factor (ECF subfamily)
MDVHTLLAEAGWLSRLARRLAADPAEAADAVQDTWVAALRSPPDAGSAVRPWLRRVLENALRMRRRGAYRRGATERDSEAFRDGAPTPEQVLARAQAERRLAELVLALDEPYRQTVLLRYHEGLTAERIAELHGVPAGTVRWRLKTALDRLRRDMDDAPEGKTWRALLAPGTVIMAKTTTTKVTLLLVLLLVLLGAGATLWRRGADQSAPPGAARPAPAPTTPARGTAADTAAAPRPELARLFAQAGLPDRRVAGRVTFDGTPLPGAAVHLALLETRTTVRSVETDAEGRFDLGAQPAAAYDVVATAPGKSAARARVDLRAPHPTPAPDALELALTGCAYRLFGEVHDGSGGVIAHARVAPAASPWPAAETDAQGRYELCLPWGPGLAVRYVAHGYNGIDVDIDLRGSMRRDVVLIPEATVGGRVVRAADGAPVAGAWITITPNERGPERGAPAAAVSDADGRFRIAGVTAGRNLLGVVAGDAVTPRPLELVTVAGESVDDLVVRVETAARLRGRVLAGGRPVAGAGVGVAVGHVAVGGFLAVTGDDGGFELAQVPPGEVALYVEGHEVTAPRGLRLAPGEARDVIVEVAALGTVTGRVLAGGTPVAGARVDCSERETGADGRYSCTGVPPGPLLLFASTADGRWGQALAQGKPPVLARGETREVDIALTYGAAICGTVVDQAGRAVAWAQVEVMLDGGHDFGAGQSDAEGRFCARWLQGGGAYRVAVLAGGSAGQRYQPAGAPWPLVAVPGPDSVVEGVTLTVRDERLAIAGRVVDPSGAPVADARVLADAIDTAGPASFRSYRVMAGATTDASGAFRITGLPGGDYAVLARGRDGGEARAPLVRAGATEVELVLAPAGRIEGRLRGFTAPPVVLGVVRDGAHEPVDAQVDGDRFRMSALPPGEYTLTATAGGEVDITVVVVRPGQTATATLASRGTGIVSGRVLDHTTKKPLAGMRCDSAPRAGDVVGVHYKGPDSGTVSDEQGRFLLDPAPAGEIIVFCKGPATSGAMRTLTLAPGQRVEVELASVALDERNGHSIGVRMELINHRIVEVLAGGPADRAGLRAGDVIVAVDGAPVADLWVRAIELLIAQRPAGQSAAVTIRRGDETRVVAVVPE